MLLLLVVAVATAQPNQPVFATPIGSTVTFKDRALEFQAISTTNPNPEINCADADCTWTFLIAKSGDGTVAQSVVTTAGRSVTYFHNFTSIGTYTVSVSVEQYSVSSASSSSLTINVFIAPTGTVSFTPNHTFVGSSVTLSGEITEGVQRPHIFVWYKSSSVDSIASKPYFFAETSSRVSSSFQVSDLVGGEDTYVTISLLLENGFGHQNTISAPQQLLVSPLPTGEHAFEAQTTATASFVVNAINLDGGLPPFTVAWTIPGTNVSVASSTTSTTSASSTAVFSELHLTGGLPTAFTIQFTVADGPGHVSDPISSAVTVMVNPKPVADPASSVTQTTVGAVISISATNVQYGTPPYDLQWTLLDAAGAVTIDTIGGVSAVSGSSTVSYTITSVAVDAAAITDRRVGLTITDSLGVSTSSVSSFALTVHPPPVPSTAFSSLTEFVDVAVTVASPSTTGGVPPYSYNVSILRTADDVVAASWTGHVGPSFSYSITFGDVDLLADASTSFYAKVLTQDSLGGFSVTTVATVAALPVPRVPAVTVPADATATATTSVAVPPVVTGGSTFEFRWTVKTAVSGSAVVGPTSFVSSSSFDFTIPAGSGGLSYIVHVEVRNEYNGTTVAVSAPVFVAEVCTTAASFSALETTVSVIVDVRAVGTSGGLGPFTYTWAVAAPGGDLGRLSLATTTSLTDTDAAMSFIAADLEGGTATDFALRLQATDKHGVTCSATSASNITVNPIPFGSPVFSPSPSTSVSADVTVSMDGLGGGTGSLTVTWDVLQGGAVVDSASSGGTVIYTFTSSLLVGGTATNFVFRGTVTDALGVAVQLHSAPITVNGPPAIVASVPVEATVARPLSLGATGSLGTPPYSFLFSILAGDGVTVLDGSAGNASSSASVSLTYLVDPSVLTGSATAIVARADLTDAGGAVATDAVHVTVYSRPGVVVTLPTETTATATWTCGGVVSGGKGPFLVSWTIFNPSGDVVDVLNASFTSEGTVSIDAQIPEAALVAGASTFFSVESTVADVFAAVGTSGSGGAPAASVLVHPPPSGGAVSVGAFATTVEGVLGVTLRDVVGGTPPLSLQWSIRRVGDLASLATSSSLSSILIPSAAAAGGPEVGTVEATATDAAGVGVVVRGANVTINPKVIPAINASTLRLRADEDIAFTVSTTYGTPPLTYAWELVRVDDNNVISLAGNTSSRHAFSVADLLSDVNTDFHVKCTVADAAGVSAFALGPGPITVEAISCKTEPADVLHASPPVCAGTASGAQCLVTCASGFYKTAEWECAYGLWNEPACFEFVSGAMAVVPTTVTATASITVEMLSLAGGPGPPYSIIISLTPPSATNASIPLGSFNASLPASSSSSFALPASVAPGTAAVQLQVLAMVASGGSEYVALAPVDIAVNPVPVWSAGEVSLSLPGGVTVGAGVLATAPAASLGTAPFTYVWSAVRKSDGMPSSSSLPASVAAILVFSDGDVDDDVAPFVIEVSAVDALGVSSLPLQVEVAVFARPRASVLLVSGNESEAGGVPVLANASGSGGIPPYTFEWFLLPLEASGEEEVPVHFELEESSGSYVHALSDGEVFLAGGDGSVVALGVVVVDSTGGRSDMARTANLTLYVTVAGFVDEEDLTEEASAFDPTILIVVVVVLVLICCALALVVLWMHHGKHPSKHESMSASFEDLGSMSAETFGRVGGNLGTERAGEEKMQKGHWDSSSDWRYSESEDINEFAAAYRQNFRHMAMGMDDNVSDDALAAIFRQTKKALERYTDRIVDVDPAAGGPEGAANWRLSHHAKRKRNEEFFSSLSWSDTGDSSEDSSAAVPFSPPTYRTAAREATSDAFPAPSSRRTAR